MLLQWLYLFIDFRLLCLIFVLYFIRQPEVIFSIPQWELQFSNYSSLLSISYKNGGNSHSNLQRYVHWYRQPFILITWIYFYVLDNLKTWNGFYWWNEKDIKNTWKQFLELCHPLGTWKKIILETATGKFFPILYQVTKVATSASFVV